MTPEQEIIARVMLALMREAGYVYTGTDIIAAAETNPRAAKYYRMALVAIAAYRGK
jgi:hypothetical protein